MKYAFRAPNVRPDTAHHLGGQTDHRLIVECQAIACTEGGGGGGEVCKDQKCLASHFRRFCCNDIDKFSIGGEKGI